MTQKPIPREHVAALRVKYAEMRRLRELDAAGEPHDPRPHMQALAERYPGALREIDELPMDEIIARIRSLDEAIEAATQPPLWAVLFIAYHGWVRAALRIKRLAGTTGYSPASDEPPLERLDADTVAAMLRPPGGRLNPWVFEQLARDYELEVEVVRVTLFPSRRGTRP